MDFKDLVVTSWQKMINNIGPVLLITFAQLVLIIITLGILAPVTTAGYLNSLMRLVREERQPAIGDLFSHMRLFLPLFLFGLLAVIAIGIGFMFLVLPGFAAIAFIAFAAFYLIPYMVDEELGLIDGLKASWDLATKQPVSDQFVVVIIYVVIMSLGSSLPFAFLITQPMATLIMITAYLERTGKSREERASAEPVSATGPTGEESDAAGESGEAGTESAAGEDKQQEG